MFKAAILDFAIILSTIYRLIYYELFLALMNLSKMMVTLRRFSNGRNNWFMLMFRKYKIGSIGHGSFCAGGLTYKMATKSTKSEKNWMFSCVSSFSQKYTKFSLIQLQIDSKCSSLLYLGKIFTFNTSMIRCEKNDKLWTVYFITPSELNIFFSESEIIVDKKGVVISRSERQSERIFYENLRRYNLSSHLIDELRLAKFGTMISLKMDRRHFLFIKGSKLMKV